MYIIEIINILPSGPADGLKYTALLAYQPTYIFSHSKWCSRQPWNITSLLACQPTYIVPHSKQCSRKKGWNITPPQACQQTYMWARSKRSSWQPWILLTPGIPANIYLLLLKRCSRPPHKYYLAPGMPADIYVGPLQAVQPTAMKYYPASGVPVTYMWAHSKQSSWQPWNITVLRACQPNIYLIPAPNGAADRYEILPRF